MRDKARFKIEPKLVPSYIEFAFIRMLKHILVGYNIYDLSIKDTISYSRLNLPLPTTCRILLIRYKPTMAYSIKSESVVVKERKSKRLKVDDLIYYVKVGQYKGSTNKSVHDKFVKINNRNQGIDAFYICPLAKDTISFQRSIDEVYLLIDHMGNKLKHDPLSIIQPVYEMTNRFHYYSFLENGGETFFHSRRKMGITQYSVPFLNKLANKFENHCFIEESSLIQEIRNIYSLFYSDRSHLQRFWYPATEAEKWDLLQAVAGKLNDDYDVKVVMISKKQGR